MDKASEETLAKVQAGWGWPLNSKKAHFYQYNTPRSLCGRWLFLGPREQGNNESVDNCAECKKRLRKIQGRT